MSDEFRYEAAPKGENNKGFLFKRKDYLEIDEHAKSHPNRTYYYKRYHDLDEVIDTCTKKLQVYMIHLNFSLL